MITIEMVIGRLLRQTNEYRQTNEKKKNIQEKYSTVYSGLCPSWKLNKQNAIRLSHANVEGFDRDISTTTASVCQATGRLNGVWSYRYHLSDSFEERYCHSKNKHRRRVIKGPTRSRTPLRKDISI